MTKIEKAETAAQIMKLCHVTDEDIQQDIFLAALSIQAENEAEFSLRISREIRDAIDKNLHRKLRQQERNMGDAFSRVLSELNDMLNNGANSRDIRDFIDESSDISEEEFELILGSLRSPQRDDILKPLYRSHGLFFRYV